MYLSVAVAITFLVLFGPLIASSQSYDDTIPASNWRIDGGLQASCPDNECPTTGWQGETRISHSSDDFGDIVINIRVTVSVLVLDGFSNSRLSADSLFTFRFSRSVYRSYEGVGWLWSPSSAATLIKVSDGMGDFLVVQTRVQVNIRTFQIQIFEIVDIVSNSCPGSSSCFGDACQSSACGDLNCPAIAAQAAGSGSSDSGSSVGGGSSDGSSGSDDDSGSADSSNYP